MKKVSALAILMLAAGSQMALAGSETGLYLGGSMGSAQLYFDSYNNYIDDSDTGYKYFVGYNFGLLPAVDLAVEASYVDFGNQYGDFLGEPTRFSNTALQAHLLGALNMGPVALFAKAGVTDWETKFTDGYHEGKTSGSDPAYGVGAKFQVGSIQLRTEYERIQLDEADMDFYSIGAAYTF